MLQNSCRNYTCNVTLLTSAFVYETTRLHDPWLNHSG